ncbi:MAG: hypothetical protein C0401_04620 [Anaerolinea sp.]|nr:hypothetical protein [Anaerolinea sp.]
MEYARVMKLRLREFLKPGNESNQLTLAYGIVAVAVGVSVGVSVGVGVSIVVAVTVAVRVGVTVRVKV